MLHLDCIPRTKSSVCRSMKHELGAIYAGKYWRNCTKSCHGHDCAGHLCKHGVSVSGRRCGGYAQHRDTTLGEHWCLPCKTNDGGAAVATTQVVSDMQRSAHAGLQ